MSDQALILRMIVDGVDTGEWCDACLKPSLVRVRYHLNAEMEGTHDISPGGPLSFAFCVEHDTGAS